MRTAILGLGITPAEEHCAQTGSTPNWVFLQHLECEVYRAALIATYGPIPAAASMPIRTHSHDFGSYAEVEIRFPADDEAAAAYATEVEQGLSTWLEAGISSPVEYDDRGIERPGSRRTAADCITGALVRARRLVADGYATAREHRLVANLTAAYPSCAASAEQLLASLAATRDAD